MIRCINTRAMPYIALCILAAQWEGANTLAPSAASFSRSARPSMRVHPSRSSTVPLAAFRADDLYDEPDTQFNPVSEIDGDNENVSEPDSDIDNAPTSWLANVWGAEGTLFRKPPPFIVDDTNLLFYDVALLLNLSLSISFWVVHRMSFFHMGTALSEGSLLCILWILAGLYNGAFLNSAVDGHRDGDEGGPRAAGLLGLSTFVGVCNLRIATALVQAMWDHRPVGVTDGEKLIPLEIVVGLVLMSLWRALHSYYTPRI